MDIHERMHTEKLYYCNDEVLMAEQAKCLEVLYDFNQTRPSQAGERRRLMEKLFAEVGENLYIEPPIHANWGIHTHFGDNVYVNFNLTLVDDTDVYIGDDVLIAPNVTIITGTHPIRPDIRRKKAQYNASVHIGDNVWIGAGSIIMPGVHIGENTVIGAGSLVTKDIPANVVAVGHPCKVMREISERDRTFYYKDMRIDID